MRNRILLAALGLALVLSASPSRSQTNPPYYTRSITTPISSTSLSFGGMLGQTTCTIVLNPTGGGNVVVTSANLNVNGSSAAPPITFFDSGGNNLGTTFTALVAKTVWFACPNANGVTFSLTTTLSYTYTFIASSAQWAFGAQGSGVPSPAPTSPADGGIIVHNTTSDFAKSLGLVPTSCAIAAAANTKNLCLSGSTTQNKYLWIVDATGNTTAGAGLQPQIGQQSVSACDTNCVNWGPGAPLATTASSVACIWGVPAPPGAFNACGSGPVGMPLPASATTFNLYLTSGGTAPSAGTIGWVYSTTLGY